MRILRELNADKSLSDKDKKDLVGAVNRLAGPQSLATRTQLTLGQTQDQAATVALSTTPEYSAIESRLQTAQGRLQAVRNKGEGASPKDWQAAFNAAKADVDAILGEVKAYREGLSPDDAKAFDRSKVADVSRNLKSGMASVGVAVTDSVYGLAVATGQLTVKSLTQQVQEQRAIVLNEANHRKGGKSPEAVAKYTRLVNQLGDTELQMLEDEVRRGAATGGKENHLFDPEHRKLFLDEGRARIESKRRAALNSEEFTTNAALPKPGSVEVESGKLRISALTQSLTELTQKARQEARGKGGKSATTTAAIKAAAEERRNLEYAQVDYIIAYRAETDKEGSEFKNIIFQKTYKDTEIERIDSKYRTAIAGEEGIHNAKGGKRDANYPITPPLENYSETLTKRLGLINKNARTSLEASTAPQRADEAFINAAQDNEQFPRAIIEQRRRQLAESKTATIGNQLETRFAQLDALRNLQIEADRFMEKNNTDFRAVASKFGVAVGEDGTINQASLNFAETGLGGQQRAEFKKAYDEYMRNLRSIPQTQDQIQAQMEGTTADISVLQAQKGARNQSREGDFAQAFSSARFDFGRDTGIDDTKLKFQVDTLSEGMKSLYTNTSNFWAAWASGATKGKSAFGDFARSVLADAARIAANKATAQVLGFIFDLAGAALGAGISASGPDISPISNLAGTGELAGVSRGPAGMLGRAYAGGLVVDNYGYPGGLPAPAVSLEAMPLMGGSTPAGAYTGGTVVNNYGSAGSFSWASKASDPTRFAGGGIISGADIGRDKVHALLAPGEAILNRSAPNLVGPSMVEAMNRGAVRRASNMPTVPSQRPQDTVNVWVLDKTTQTPPPGPRDMIAAITDDILTGGQTRKLIKQVTLGQI